MKEERVNMKAKVLINGSDAEIVMAHYNALKVLIDGIKAIENLALEEGNQAIRDKAVEVLAKWDVARANKPARINAYTQIELD